MRAIRLEHRVHTRVDDLLVLLEAFAAARAEHGGRVGHREQGGSVHRRCEMSRHEDEGDEVETGSS